MVRLIVMPSLPFDKHRLLIALFHFIAKVRQFANPRLLIKAAVVEFIGAFFRFYDIREVNLFENIQDNFA